MVSKRAGLSSWRISDSFPFEFCRGEVSGKVLPWSSSRKFSNRASQGDSKAAWMPVEYIAIMVSKLKAIAVAIVVAITVLIVLAVVVPNLLGGRSQ